MLHIWKNASIAIQTQDFTPQRFGDLKQMLEFNREGIIHFVRDIKIKPTFPFFINSNREICFTMCCSG